MMPKFSYSPLYNRQIGPLPSLAGTLSSLLVLLILCHWRNLKKPQYAMLKMLFLGLLLFGMGTLPWQQNFTGLISGLLFGITFTLALTPYLSLTKYTRKGKVGIGRAPGRLWVFDRPIPC